MPRIVVNGVPAVGRRRAGAGLPRAASRARRSAEPRRVESAVVEPLERARELFVAFEERAATPSFPPAPRSSTRTPTSATTSTAWSAGTRSSRRSSTATAHLALLHVLPRRARPASRLPRRQRPHARVRGALGRADDPVRPARPRRRSRSPRPSAASTAAPAASSSTRARRSSCSTTSGSRRCSRSPPSGACRSSSTAAAGCRRSPTTCTSLVDAYPERAADHRARRHRRPLGARRPLRRHGRRLLRHLRVERDRPARASSGSCRRSRSSTRPTIRTAASRTRSCSRCARARVAGLDGGADRRDARGQREPDRRRRAAARAVAAARRRDVFAQPMPLARIHQYLSMAMPLLFVAPAGHVRRARARAQRDVRAERPRGRVARADPRAADRARATSGATLPDAEDEAEMRIVARTTSRLIHLADVLAVTTHA